MPHGSSYHRRIAHIRRIEFIFLIAFGSLPNGDDGHAFLAVVLYNCSMRRSYICAMGNGTGEMTTE